jgi:hypothetical protein
MPKDDAVNHFDISHSVDAVYEPKPKQGSGCRNFWHRVFGLERIGRVWRDLVDLEGLSWGGPLPLIGLV